MTLHPIPKLEDLEVAGRRALVRVDFNVPIKDGTVQDDTRIRAALPTIQTILGRGGRVILASHLGRPKGKPSPEYSLEPAAARLAELMNDGEVILADDCVGDGPRKVVGDLRDGQLVVLENLRFHPEEKANDDTFARELASFADVYVNDAFGVAHRSHASVVALPKLVRERAAGLLMQAEITALTRIRTEPKRPVVALLGGAKVSDKIKLIESLLGSVDTLILGGAMANTFLAAQGHDLQESLFEPERLAVARSLLLRAEEMKVAVLLPSDVRVGASTDASTALVVPVDSVPDSHMVLDIGPSAIERFAVSLQGAATVFWNGPMGLFENPTFAEGTFSMAKAIADSHAFSVVGGGESLAAVNQSGLTERFGHISTGGGASLAFMQGDKLPALEALQ